jgi:hypothetical protein
MDTWCGLRGEVRESDGSSLLSEMTVRSGRWPFFSMSMSRYFWAPGSLRYITTTSFFKLGNVRAQ